MSRVRGAGSQAACGCPGSSRGVCEGRGWRGGEVAGRGARREWRAGLLGRFAAGRFYRRLSLDTVDGTIRAASGTVYMTEDHEQQDRRRHRSFIARRNLDHVGRYRARSNWISPECMRQGSGCLATQRATRIVLLTGDAKAPPKAVGAQGTTTGATLRFNSCDGSVVALGAAGERVNTDARISNEEKKDKGKR